MAIHVVPLASQIATAGFLFFTWMRLQKLRRCFVTKIFRRSTVSGGSAQQLSNGKVAFGVTAPSDNPKGSRYMEVTHDPTPQVVSQIDVDGQNSYRAVHVPSLYPGVQW